jgi:hypothetical protein
MAVDGSYKIEFNTPIGKQNGKIVMRIEGGSLRGSITNMFGTEDFTDGKVNGDQFEFTVDGKTPMGPAKVDMKGTVNGDQVSGEMSIRIVGMNTKFNGNRE